jgi:hypothetical protein
MKIRLIGSADLVRAWRLELERAYGLRGAEYPTHGSTHELRVYFDMDDRLAAAAVGLTPPRTAERAHPVATSVTPATRAVARRPKKGT